MNTYFVHKTTSFLDVISHYFRPWPTKREKLYYVGFGPTKVLIIQQANLKQDRLRISTYRVALLSIFKVLMQILYILYNNHNKILDYLHFQTYRDTCVTLVPEQTSYIGINIKKLDV